MISSSTMTFSRKTVYIFLDGLDDRLDKARSEVLQMAMFPIVEQANAYFRQEDLRQAVMMGTQAPTAASLAAKGTHQLVGHTSATGQPSQMPSSVVVPL